MKKLIALSLTIVCLGMFSLGCKNTTEGVKQDVQENVQQVEEAGADAVKKVEEAGEKAVDEVKDAFQ